MPPKKKAKTEPKAKQEDRSASSSETLIMPGPLESVPATIYGANEGYMRIVMSNVITIKEMVEVGGAVPHIQDVEARLGVGSQNVPVSLKER